MVLKRFIANKGLKIKYLIKMSDIIEKYENPCDDCMHRVNSYCKAYNYSIKILDVNKCKRRKIKKNKR